MVFHNHLENQFSNKRKTRVDHIKNNNSSILLYIFHSNILFSLKINIFFNVKKIVYIFFQTKLNLKKKKERKI